MMSKHTPGPWEFCFETVDPEWAVVVATRGKTIANVNADWRQEANACLISAAPEMYWALKFVCETVERPPAKNCTCHISPPCNDCVDHSLFREMFETINAAIAKAEGRR